MCTQPFLPLLHVPLANTTYSTKQHGTIHWLEIPVIDAARAAAFYTSIFGVSQLLQTSMKKRLVALAWRWYSLEAERSSTIYLDG